MKPGGDVDRTAIFAHIACVWEATARKVGNVHPGAAFADVEFADFLSAAAVLGQAVAGRDRGMTFGAGVGRVVLLGGGESRFWTGTNTNLGIALLLAPLAMPNDTKVYREQLREVLAGLTVTDAEYVYRAISVANPGGLGTAPEQDVRQPPTVTLLEAMRLAAHHDLVARQYATDFADVFEFGVPVLANSFAKFRRVEPALIENQLRWLAAYPDSLIARKNGPATAEDVRRRAEAVLVAGGLDTAEGRRAGVELDRYLRSDGNKLNPGTTADLVTACLFVALRQGTVKPSDPFRWDIPDWL